MANKPVILVAVDGSETSFNAVTYLSRNLSPKRIGIELFHVRAGAPEAVFDLGSPEDNTEYGAEITKWNHRIGSTITEFMQAAKQLLTAAGFPEDSVTIAVQDRRIGIARDIINRAKLGCEAVVVGRRGYGTLPEFMLGSVAAKLSEMVSHVPLAVVGTRPEARKILVAFDRSQTIRKGFERVSNHFARTIEEILLCHIVRPLSTPHPATTPFFSLKRETQWLDENSRKIIPAMVEAKQHLTRSGFDPDNFRTAILKEKTSRANGLAQEAQTLNFGTIVIGRRGASSVEDFSMGRVTRKLLSLSPEKAIWIV